MRQLLIAVSFLAAIPAAAAPLRLASYEFDPSVDGLPAISAALTRATPAADAEANWIVQLEGPVSPAARADVTAAAEILGYLPDHAFLVRARSNDLTRLANEPSVRWIGDWQPAYKLSPTIGRIVREHPEAVTSPVRPFLVWTAGDRLAAAADLESAGATIDDEHPRRPGARFAVRMDPADVETLARFESVLWIEEIPEFRVWNDRTTWVAQSNVANQFPVWNWNLHGEGQIACVMDSGLDYNSCWFRDPGLVPGPSHRKVISYTTWGGSAYDGCSNGHGTHVCGTLAGDQSYVNPGVTAANGLAFGAKLMLQDIGADDFFSCLLGFVNVPADLSAAYDAAVAGGAHVHSNSWGSTSNSYDGYANDVDDAMWRHPDFLVVFAAGNSGPGASTVGSPGTAKNCVTVGATRQTPNQEQMASYSSRGPTSDSRYKPTVTLPGGDDTLAITSADNNTGNPPSSTCASVGFPFYGTSMATPAVSASALLVRQYFEQGFYPYGGVLPSPRDVTTPSAALVKAVLVNSGADMGTADIPNHNEGFGRVLLDDALYFGFDDPSEELRVEDERGGVDTGQVATFTYGVEAGGPFEVTLVWTDFPATAGAGIALVNDLDLEVEAPGGAIYRGNVFSGGESTTGGTADRRNVEEAVRVSSPAAGDWTIRVRGFNVPSGPQPFALVATGGFSAWPPATDAPDVTVASPALDLAVSPNPGRGLTRIELALPADSPVDVEVFDVRGARVAVAHSGVLPAGRNALSWDGRDASGREVPGGVYFVRARTESEVISRKITRIP
ncbi:MAG: S8 family serine peptidase [Gemmatimonadetes bacterium]|nr:S8 family serine peptidase [Gemmatimonadota bacterium]